MRGSAKNADEDEDEDEDFLVMFEKPQKPRKSLEAKYLASICSSAEEDSHSRQASVKKDRTGSAGKKKLIIENEHPPSIETTLDTRPPPPVQSTEELFYFSQYVKFFDNLDTGCAEHPSRRRETDDACYLCKDGGVLIECDWRRSKGNLRCLKCYHETCLSYSIPGNQEWICMRHFCMNCGDKKLKYMCKYCSNSVCAACPEKVVEKVCAVVIYLCIICTYNIFSSFFHVCIYL